MRDNNLLWRPPPEKPTRMYDGGVMVPESDRRWCPDTFEIRCWNNAKVRVAFAMDCCDRKIMSWLATTGGINGQMIRDLIAESVDVLFGAAGLPHSIQWLSDNGSIYTAKKTRRFAAEAGFEVCTTPAYSPESNGMAESFVKTFKRDYVQVHNLETPEEVLM